MESTSLRKKVALLGVPDDALDVLTHYTQGGDWDTVVVVSPSPDAYAARMADVLGIPVTEEPDPEQLAACDLVIVGPDAGVDVATIRELLENEPVLVADLEEVSRELQFHPFQDGEFEPQELEIESYSRGDLVLPPVAEDSETSEENGPFDVEETYASEDDYTSDDVDEESATEEDEDPATEDAEAEVYEDAFEAAAAEIIQGYDLSPKSVDDRIDIHGSPAVERKRPPPKLEQRGPELYRARNRSVTEKERSRANETPRTAKPNRTAGQSSEPRCFDLTACLGQDPEAQFAAVPLDGDSQEFQTVLEEVLAATGAQTGSIMLPDADGEHLAIAASIGLPRDLVMATRPKLGEGLAGRAYATGVAAVLQGEVPQFAEAAGLTHRVAASIPIQRDGRRMGVLSINIDSREPVVETELLKTLDRFIVPAQRAIFRSVDLAELPWVAQQEILFRALDAVMGLDAGFPERLVETGELLRRTVRADFVHVYLNDPLSQRLELISPARGLSATEGRYLPLDRGFYSWVVDRGVFQLLTAPDPESGFDRGVACLPVRTSRPCGLLVLEHFKVKPEERTELRDLLVSVVEQLEEIFEVEQGVESQDILAGLRMRISDKKNELELLPAALRAQSVLEFAIQVLAAEAAVWLEGPGARPVIAQPQTRQAARIVADVWDSLDTLCGWIREYGSVASGSTGPGWEPGAPPGPSPYVGVRDERGSGVIMIFFNDEERGTSVQLPARILVEVLRSLCALIPPSEVMEEYSAEDESGDDYESDTLEDAA